MSSVRYGIRLGDLKNKQPTHTGKLVHLSEIYQYQMLFGGDYGKDTGSFVSAVKNAIAAVVAAILEITIKDEENEFDSKEFKEEYEKILRDAVEYTTPIIKALNELLVYYRYHHIKNGLALGKGRYQDFTKKRNLSQKRKEKKRKEI